MSYYRYKTNTSLQEVYQIYWIWYETIVYNFYNTVIYNILMYKLYSRTKSKNNLV